MTSPTAAATSLLGRPVAPEGARAADPYRPHRQELLSPDRVRALSQLRPWRVVVDTIGCWALIVGAWALVATAPGLPAVLLAIPVVGSRYYALFIIGHDGMHRRLFRRRWLNDLWNDLFCQGAIGSITRLNNRNHLRHHQYLATEDDPDRHKHACFNKVEHGELLGFLSGFGGLIRTVLNVFRPTRAASRQASDEAEGGYALRDVAIVLGVQAAIAGGLTLGIGWWAYPVLWLVPVFGFTYLADNFRSFAEHSQPAGDAASDRHRLITYTSNPVERWFVAPMNMNFHAAHHLWPSIPYYHLPAADREMRAHPRSAGLEWRASYVGYLRRYWRAQPLEECRGGH
ncbi:MAG: fatty acid desaturase [Gemmatimonadales bacterium]